jgi:hypothetical protein
LTNAAEVERGVMRRALLICNANGYRSGVRQIMYEGYRKD